MMNGKILAYSATVLAGVIQGQDGKIYHFNLSDWQSSDAEPSNGGLVVFDANRRSAFSVRMAKKHHAPARARHKKSRPAGAAIWLIKPET